MVYGGIGYFKRILAIIWAAYTVLRWWKRMLHLLRSSSEMERALDLARHFKVGECGLGGRA